MKGLTVFKLVEVTDMFNLYRSGGGTSSPKYRIIKRLGLLARTLDRWFLCYALNHHVAHSYFQGYPPHLVHWICGRCNHYRHWGYESDGPRGKEYPSPSQYELEEWSYEGKLKMEREDAERLARNAIDVEGECNERLNGQKCRRYAGHDGLHGVEISPGFILAPWSK